MRTRKPGGFTLWELMIVIALIVMLILVAIENLLPLRGDAERASHVATVGALKSAVGLESTERVLEGGAVSLRQMNNDNPVDWLQVPMDNFVGDVTSNRYGEIPPGSWAFDSHAGLLVYRVRYPEYFEGSSAEPAVIRYRVVVREESAGRVTGVGLEQLDSGEWRTDESQLLRWMGG